MQVMVPSEYRQHVRWFLNLDAASFAILMIGAVIAFNVLKGQGPLASRIVEFLGIAGLTVVLAVVKWPIEHGDRLTTWARRAWDYYWRPRRGSAWGDA